MKNFTAQVAAVALATLLLNGCASTKTTSTTTDDADDKITIKMKDAEEKDANQVAVGENNSMELVDYLRRIPGLQVDQRGTNVNVFIRGINSMSGDNNPLFVVNSSPIGNSYAEAVNAVDVNDIKTVNVIKGAEGQQMYGMRAANGVVQILTKRK